MRKIMIFFLLFKRRKLFYSKLNQNNIKNIFILFSCVLFGQYAFAEAFLTKDHVIGITDNCQEGDVSCQNMGIDFFDRKTCRLNKTTGKTRNSPETFDVQGYYFHVNNYDYFLYLGGSPSLENYEHGKFHSSEPAEYSDKNFNDIIQSLSCE